MSNEAKLSARERIEALVDANSFVEIGALITKRNTDFNMQEKSVPGDGVVTGYGLIDGSVVYVYSQDAASVGGSIGEMHAKKICNMYDMAMKAGAPVIGLIDCAGLRLQEATDALNGFGSIYAKQVEASGLITQISAVFGTCGGGLAVSSVLSDFTFMEKGAKLFVNSPNALCGNYTDKCDTSGADFQSTANTVDFVCEGEAELIAQIRDFVSYLPANCEDMAISECDDDLNRLVPEFAADYADPAKALADISDGGKFVEVKSGYAKEMVTGFIKLNGMTIGAVANRSAVLDDAGKASETYAPVLTTAGCGKAEDFIYFCDSFGIPVLTLTNVTGYAATVEEEKTIAAAAAKLTAAFVNTDVPKVNLITEKAYGTAYVSMNSKHIGADMVFALDGAEIGMMDAKNAVKIMYADEISAASDKTAFIDEKAASYAELQSGAAQAAQRGYVDVIINPESVRKQLVYAFEMLY